MAAIFNDDESTEDEIDVDLHLGERLRINRGENSKFMEDKVIENNKDYKQYYNMHRKKFVQEGQSSSSSSIEVQNDNPISGLHNSDNCHNKKRQNLDKNIEQLANPKRTCLSDRFHISPESLVLKMKANDHDSVKEKSLFPDSFYLHRGASSDLFTDKKCEEHVNNLADAEDSDFEVPVKMNRNTKLENGQNSKNFKVQFSTSNKVKSFENAASTSYFNKFYSDSEDESKSDAKSMQNGTLKGGRQESTADSTHYNKKLFGRKVNRKVLDSDETEDDTSLAMYRSRPLIFSSSDSEDFIPNSPKHKQVGSASTDPTGHSHYGDDLDERASSSTHCKQFKPFRTNPKRAICSMSSKADSADGCDRQFLNNDFHRKNVPQRTCKTRRSAKINIPSNLSANSFTKSNSISSSARGRRVGGGERGARRSGSPHHRSNRCQHKSSDETKCHGRSASVSRTQMENPSYVTRYPEVFNAEESENEFFTANSYSDTETSTESLGGLTINTDFPNHSDSLPCTMNCENRLCEDASSDDEISVVFSTGPYGRHNETRRGTPRALGRRHTRGTPHRQLQNAREIVSLSPDPVEQVRQVEEDERMARMLQAQFDAEMDADYAPVLPHNISENEDSEDDDDIIDPIGESDSDESPNPSTFPFLPINRRGLGMNRFTANRSGVPTAIFLGSRRMDNRTRRSRPLHNHFNIPPREHPESHFSIRLPDLAASFLNDYETLLGLDLADDIPRGLTKGEINRLPTRKYIHPNSALSSSGSEVTHRRTELNKECQVCLTDYETGDMLRILPCFHEFHTPCIDPWLSINFTCPVCRVTVDLDA